MCGTRKEVRKYAVQPAANLYSACFVCVCVIVILNKMHIIWKTTELSNDKEQNNKAHNFGITETWLLWKPFPVANSWTARCTKKWLACWEVIWHWNHSTLCCINLCYHCTVHWAEDDVLMVTSLATKNLLLAYCLSQYTHFWQTPYHKGSVCWVAYTHLHSIMKKYIKHFYEPVNVLNIYTLCWIGVHLCQLLSTEPNSTLTIFKDEYFQRNNQSLTIFSVTMARKWNDEQNSLVRVPC